MCGTCLLAEELIVSYEGLLLYEVSLDQCMAIATSAAAWGRVGCILDFVCKFLHCFICLVLLPSAQYLILCIDSYI